MDMDVISISIQCLQNKGLKLIINEKNIIKKLKALLLVMDNCIF